MSFQNTAHLVTFQIAIHKQARENTIHSLPTGTNKAASKSKLKVGRSEYTEKSRY